MIRHRILALGLVCFTLTNVAHAADVPTVIATGDWSKPVADHGRAVRGRLVVGEKNGQTAVYVELQDASDSVGEMTLFCDLGKHDFRPENKSGLWCELRDKNQKPVPMSPFAFGGGIPKSEWVTLPADGMIRLRATPFGIGAEGARAICPSGRQYWLIKDDDPNDYFLSGNFAIQPATKEIEHDGKRVWRGTLELPAATIPSKVIKARR
jgi:hypothetical protein